jgi:hypothetical protein
MQPIVNIELAIMIGTTIEWYDFLLCGSAALVFKRLFFPDLDRCYWRASNNTPAAAFSAGSCYSTAPRASSTARCAAFTPVRPLMSTRS